MTNINFDQECVTVSDPANRLLFQHEENVNGFLNIASKQGRGRAWLFIHLSNPRLAMHGGVRDHRGALGAPWSENGHSYDLSPCWGMIGDLDTPKPHAYLFRLSPKLDPDARSPDTLPDGADIEASALNPFEAHALALLQNGQKLVRWECRESMHALGAIRAEAECLRCHDNHKVGDLLGAFTYSYIKSKAVPPDAKAKQMLALSNEGKTLLQVAKSAGLLNDPKQSAMAPFYAGETVRRALLQQGIVTAEMLADQARESQRELDTDLGAVKKPNAAAGAK